MAAVLSNPGRARARTRGAGPRWARPAAPGRYASPPRLRPGVVPTQPLGYPRYMNSPDPDGAAALDILDPDHDPTASYALDQALVRQLTGLVLSTSGETKRSVSPVTGQPLGDIPQSSEETSRRPSAGRARRAGVGPHVVQGARRGVHAAARPRAGAPGRDHGHDLLGVRQGPQARVRRAVHIALTARYYARTAGSTSAPGGCRRRTGADPGRGQPPPQGRRRHHLALELPLHDGAVRRPRRGHGRQRRRLQARRADHAHRPDRAGAPA